MPVPSAYPLDLTGTATSNLVTDEEHIFDSPDKRVFVPTGGSFFGDGFRIYDGETGRELFPNEYKLLHLNSEGCLASTKRVFVVVYVNNLDVASVDIQYQAIGGQYAESGSTLYELIANLNLETLNTYEYGRLIGLPATFPPVAHYHTPYEFTGWGGIIGQLSRIESALLQGDQLAFTQVYDYIRSYVNGKLVSGGALTQTQADNRYYTRDTVDNKLAAIATDANLRADLTSLSNAYNVYTASSNQTISDLQNSLSSLQLQFSNFSPDGVSVSTFNTLAQRVTTLENRNYVAQTIEALPYATTTVDGKVRKATDNEVSAGANDTKYITSKQLSTKLAAFSNDMQSGSNANIISVTASTSSNRNPIYIHQYIQGVYFSGTNKPSYPEVEGYPSSHILQAAGAYSVKLMTTTDRSTYGFNGQTLLKINRISGNVRFYWYIKDYVAPVKSTPRFSESTMSVAIWRNGSIVYNVSAYTRNEVVNILPGDVIMYTAATNDMGALYLFVNEMIVADVPLKII